MKLTYKQGNLDNLFELKNLALKSWQQFQTKLSDKNWQQLYQTLTDDKTYIELLTQSHCIICVSESNKIIGMAFIVPSGNPTDIYEKEWSYIRFVSVDPDFSGLGIGKKLTIMCIDNAKQNNEKIVALHTSEIMNNARHIYENLGFTILKEIDKRLGIRYWLYKLDISKK